jgi:hypothetical protein
MTQTLALFLDAYRELNARKMFWVCLILSGVIVLSFLAVGVNAAGSVSLFGMDTSWTLPISKAELYGLIFTNLGVGMWLTMIGLILALVSTASIFPELITGGSIDLYLSKPISRPRLFLTKYLAGLMFAALQVLVFSAACFIVIGLRGGVWLPRLFLAVPIVVCFFSYLFCICVLWGLWTRSTLAAVLLTMVFWFGLWAVDQAETLLLRARIDNQRQVELAQHDRNPEREKKLASSGRTITAVHRVLYATKTVLPKTRATNELLDRALLHGTLLENMDPTGGEAPATQPNLPGWADPRIAQAAQAEQLHRPVWWVIGTSLGFEAVIVALATWTFSRRDF